MLNQLLLTIALLGGGDHARFHPAQPDVYVEMPDVAAVWKAYESAPLMKTLGDPAVGKIADLAQQMGVDVRKMVQDAMPVADPNRPDDRYWPWSAARTMSLSVEGLDAPNSSTGTATPTNEVAAIAEGMSGRASGWMIVDFVDAISASQALQALAATGGITRVTIADDAPLEIEGKQLPLTRIEASLFGKPVPMWIACDGPRWIAGTGQARPADLTRRLADVSTSFAPHHGARMSTDGLGPARGTLVANGWSDWERLASGPPSMGGTLLDTFLPSLVPFVGQRGRYRLQLDGGRFVTESLVEHIGPARELDALYGAGPVAPSTTRMVAAEAVGAWVMTIQPAAFESMLGRVLAQADVPPANGDGQSFAPALGEGAAMFVQPLAVGNMTSGDVMPNVVMAVELRDPVAFEAALGPWIERARAAQPKLVVDNKPYRKIPMYTFAWNEPGAEADTQVKPTLTILPDRVLLTTSRKYAQSEVRRLDAKPTTVHAIAQEGAVPKEAFEAGTMDWGGMFTKLYDAAKGFLPMVAQNAEKPIDVNALPTAQELFRFLQPSKSYSKRVGSRTYTYGESSFGPETPLTLGLIGLVMGGRGQQTIARGTVLEDGPPANSTKATQPEAGVTPSVPAERTASVASMKTIKIGISVFKSQFDRAPATLDELLRPTDAFPKGFVDDPALLRDGWGRPFVYAVAADGRKFELRSSGPNGVDDKGSGDDVTLSP